MTENEVEEIDEVEEMGTWSMDELVGLTETVQHDSIEYRGKQLKFHFCELTEKEEPKFTGVSEDLPENEKMEMFQEIGAQRVLKMLLKANEKNPENITIEESHWLKLPTTLRYGIATKMMNIETEVKANFTP